MKLHTVFVTHNRLELTKQAIQTYLETVSVPFTFIVVDNGSTDGTAEWIQAKFPWGAWALNEDGSQQSYYWLSPDNLYPGAACNEGWFMLEEWAGTHFHRADNDHAFLPGWCEEVKRMFRNPEVGQVGMRINEHEPNGDFNVGGNNVIRRELWDQGIRYDERPWTEMPPGYSEDSFFTPEVERLGWKWTRVKKQCIYELEAAYPDTNTDEYYERSWGARRLYGRTP